jgi:hypothetical protein
MLEKNDLKDAAIVEMIKDRFKQIHRMDGHGRTCTPYDLIYGYLKGAEHFRVQRPDGLNKILHRVEEIKHVLPSLRGWRSQGVRVQIPPTASQLYKPETLDL